VARAFTASEIATEAGVSVDLLTWIVEIGIVAATLLQRRADAIATHAGGRLVKLLGDGALLHFPQAARSSAAAIELVDALSAEGTLSAHAGIHAGPVIERDLDVSGATVNLASRIAGVA
jgi:class 3 adenylate cyclase